VPSAPINTIAEALEDPQVRHLGLVRGVGLGDEALRLIGSPVDFNVTNDRNDLPPPGLGDQTDAVLGGLGYTAEEIAALRRDGVV
jgi:crotonobetainyl-CoA:carnitine CoA-transferase CaiB-like acyl-CoA transferase